jgi:hypothetical protein
MANFCIAKRVTPKTLKDLSKKLNKPEDSLELLEVLKQQILKDTQSAMFNNKIPGLITNVKKKSNNSPKIGAVVGEREMDVKTKARILLFVSAVIQKILEQKMTINDQCFLVTKLVSGLGLKEADFRMFNGVPDDIDDECDDDDDDAGYDENY